MATRTPSCDAQFWDKMSVYRTGDTDTVLTTRVDPCCSREGEGAAVQSARDAALVRRAVREGAGQRLHPPLQYVSVRCVSVPKPATCECADPCNM